MQVQINDITFTLEVAKTSEELARGLMYRKNIPNRTGMLFIFPKNEVQSMWMKNTPSSLDILYLDEGLNIVSISKNAVPFSLAKISSKVPAKYAIEVAAYTVKLYGIKVGQKVVRKK